MNLIDVLKVVRPELTEAHLTRMSEVMLLTEGHLYVEWAFLQAHEKKVRLLRRDMEKYLEQSLELVGVYSLETHRQGEATEKEARDLLVAAGHEILWVHPKVQMRVKVDSRIIEIPVVSDFETRVGSRRYIVEVKKSYKTVKYFDFRRQILETQMAWPGHRLLIITGGVIQEVDFLL